MNLMKPEDFNAQARRRLNGTIAMLCPGSRRPRLQVARTLRSIARAFEAQHVAEEQETARVGRMREKAGAK